MRSNLRLRRAWTRLDLLYEETEELFKRVKATRDICELRNLINVGYLITRQAMERKESRGRHIRSDYTFTNPLLRDKFLRVWKDGDAIRTEWRDRLI